MIRHLAYAYPLLVALATTYLLVPAVKRLAPALGMVDQPGGRHLHRRPVPRCGGLAVFLGFHAGLAALFLLPVVPVPPGHLDVVWFGRFLILSGLLLALGLADDRWPLGAFVKLGGQALVAALAFGMEMRFGKLMGVPLPVVVDFVCTVVWCVAIINAFNLIDGMDGLAAGLAVIAAAGIAVGLVLRHHPGDAVALSALVGACLAFLRYNFHPASVFLGDSGSMFLGFALAVIPLSTSSKETAVASIGFPLLAVGIPIFDAFLAVWRRTMRKALHWTETGHGEVSVFGGDADHLHHRLMRTGLSDRKVAAWLYLGAGALVAVGLLRMLFWSHALGIALCAFVVGVYVVVRHLARVELWDSGYFMLEGMRKPPGRAVMVLLYPPLDVLVLSLALLVTLRAVHPDESLAQLGRLWLIEAPAWVAVPFIGLCVSSTYNRVWSRARVSEYVLLAATLAGGILLAAGLSGIIRTYPERKLLLMLVGFAALALPALAGVRTVPRVVQDAMTWAARHQGDRRGQETTPALVVGAGLRGTLFLRSLALEGRDTPALPFRIVGLVDTDSNLHGRFVYGYKVLGGLDRIGPLAGEYGIRRLILTDPLPPADVEELLRVAREVGADAVEWQTGLRALGAETPGPRPAH